MRPDKTMQQAFRLHRKDGSPVVGPVQGVAQSPSHIWVSTIDESAGGMILRFSAEAVKARLSDGPAVVVSDLAAVAVNAVDAYATGLTYDQSREVVSALLLKGDWAQCDGFRCNGSAALGHRRRWS